MAVLSPNLRGSNNLDDYSAITTRTAQTSPHPGHCWIHLLPSHHVTHRPWTQGLRMEGGKAFPARGGGRDAGGTQERGSNKVQRRSSQREDREAERTQAGSLHGTLGRRIYAMSRGTRRPQAAFKGKVHSLATNGTVEEDHAAYIQVANDINPNPSGDERTWLTGSHT